MGYIHSPNMNTFIMGNACNELKTPTPPNAGSGFQSFVRVLNFISWVVRLSKEIQK